MFTLEMSHEGIIKERPFMQRHSCVSVSNMFPTGLFCLVFSAAAAPVLALKSWIPTTNINDKRNWNVMDLPRNCDEISFDISNDLTVSWSMEDLLVTGLRLPISGILTFETDMSIGFKDKALCPGSRVIKYIRDEWKGWLDPFNWESHSDGMWLPHAMRIPCTGEDVKFPPGNNFAVQLPNIKVPVGKISLDDEEFDGDDWSEFLNTERGKSQFRSEEIMQEPWLHDSQCPVERKCLCGKSSYVFENRKYRFVPSSVLHQAVCLYAKPKCQSIGCYSPVLPEGHCCGVCGAIIKVRDVSKDDRFLNEILNIVKKKLHSESAVRYYVGRTMDENIEIVVLSETSDATDDALTSSAWIRDSLTERNFPVISEKFSGPTLSGNFLNSSTGIIFGTFLAVVLFFGIIYIVYVILPEKNIMKINEQPFGFARFRNVLHEAGSEEKLEIGTEVLPCESSRGFHNPTFSNNDGASTSRIHEESTEDTELEAGQEYDNPTYHEMEKTREFLEGKAGEEGIENLNEISEIEL